MSARNRQFFRDLALEADPHVAHLRRLMQSLQHPLSPEGKRVFAAAKVGLQLLLEKSETKRTKRAPLSAVRGGTPLEEDKLPGCIREMLAQYRENEKLSG